MGWQRVGHDWATEVNWTELILLQAWVFRMQAAEKALQPPKKTKKHQLISVFSSNDINSLKGRTKSNLAGHIPEKIYKSSSYSDGETEEVMKFRDKSAPWGIGLLHKLSVSRSPITSHLVFLVL